MRLIDKFTQVFHFANDIDIQIKGLGANNYVLTAIVFCQVTGNIFWQDRHLLVQHLLEFVHCHPRNTPNIGIGTLLGS